MKYVLATILTTTLVQTAAAADLQDKPMDRMPMGQPMPMEQPASVAPTAKASGTIKAIDAGKGTVTLAHGPVPSLQWPPMTMGFAATPEQLKGLKVGDQVNFEFQSQGMTARIVSIRKAD
ncbi:Cu(I)/Ag(I) efflux system protein CusF [Geopseudomonas sagittaria]|uniref:Cu(I)/Ag(I) efflux system protein CusF n=1 Tax=Geopseudomonas sagittaria TaxID=1135990 RepID=A0A1I5QUF2_9GAMM|nr:copper-binding protein [Pseudomonas sagittaria]SFP49885.1 Cu(I)/Ag(I) efflux system protein CusF [Pseudomonas sagittaria]